jgi:hypothetical protein
VNDRALHIPQDVLNAPVGTELQSVAPVRRGAVLQPARSAWEGDGPYTAAWSAEDLPT